MFRRPPTATPSRPLSLAVTALLAVLMGSVVLSGGAAAAENATFSPHDENATFLPETNQTVSGNTTLDAGSTVQVRLESAGDDRVPFIKTATTNVTDEGTYEASFNFSSMPRRSGGPVTVTVLAPNESNTTYEYETRFLDATPFDPRDENRTVETGPNVTLAGYTTLDEGTEVEVRVEASGESPTPFLQSRTTNVTVNRTYAATFDLSDAANRTASMLVTVRRSNGSENASYEYELPVRSSRNESDTQNGTATPQTTATPTPAATETPTETVTQTPTRTQTDESTPAADTATKTTETTTPGFGVGIAVAALVSLVAVVVALVRRS